MSTKSPKTPPYKLKSGRLYQPIEHAVICDWLGRPRPPHLQHIDIYNHAGGLRGTRPSRYHGRLALPIAVGTIALEVAGRRARIARAQLRRRKRRGPDLRYRPRTVLTIYWAEGHGQTWDEDYLVTELPGYRVKVLIMQAGSAEAFGFDTLALGVVTGHGRGMHGECRLLIEGWWGGLAIGGQGRWQSVFGTRFFSERTANACARRVWPHEEPYDDCY